jgi:hypothetical protein
MPVASDTGSTGHGELASSASDQLPLVTGCPAGLLVAAGLACALAGALSFGSTRSDARLASSDQA